MTYREKFDKKVPKKIQELVMTEELDNIKLALELWNKDIILAWIILADRCVLELGLPLIKNAYRNAYREVSNYLVFPPFSVDALDHIKSLLDE